MAYVPPPTDSSPATQNVTVIDSSSSTATGANNQSIIIGTPTVGSAASFALSSVETVRVEVTGIWTGALSSEISVDGGTTWTAQGLHQGAYTTSTFTAGFIGGANVTGITNYRIRATATITGTAVVKIIQSANTQSVYIANAAPAGNVTSVLNSTATTLLSGAVYTGTGEDVSNFSEMRVSVFSNVASATDGLSVQQSSDNTNWDIVDTYTIAAATAGQGKTFVVPRQARYFRVVYTNGGTNQTTFRLASILNRTATSPSSNRAGDAYTNETDLVQNQTFNMGFNGTTWDRLRSTTANGLAVDVTRLSALVAGSAVVGKVGIDQTTPGTTNLVALAANQSTNTVQLNGTTVDTNSGNKSAGTQRVVIATDQPNLTTPLNENIAQINGVAPVMGNGVTGTGSQRVTIASDNTAFSVNSNQGIAAASTAGWPTINGELGDVTGTFTNATQTTSVTASGLVGYGNTLISINGTYGTATAVFEGSDDSGTTWYTVQAARDNTNVIELGYTSLTNTNQTWQINNPGFDSIRVRSTAVASGTVNVRLSSSAAPVASGTIVGIGAALPAGSALIGHVIADIGSTTAVTQATGTNLHAVLDSGTLTTLTTLTGTTTLTPGTGATNLGKAEDAASASTDTGVFTLGVRRGSGALSSSPTSATGDYQEFAQDDFGAVRTAYLAKTANPTAATDGNSVVPLTDKLGKVVSVGSIRDLKANQVTTITSSTAETTIVTSVASTFLDMYGLIITNTSATAVNVAIKDATAGTTRFNIAVPAGDTRGFMLPEGGAIKQAAVTNNWTATVSASVASIIVTALTVQNL